MPFHYFFINFSSLSIPSITKIQVGIFIVAFFRPFGLYDKQIVRILGFICFGLVTILGVVDIRTTWYSWPCCQQVSTKFVRTKLCRYDCDDEEEISCYVNSPKTKVANLDGRVQILKLRERSPSPGSFPKDRKRCYV